MDGYSVTVHPTHDRLVVRSRGITVTTALLQPVGIWILHTPSAILVDWEISRMKLDGDSNASDASFEYRLFPRGLYFDWYEAVHRTV